VSESSREVTVPRVPAVEGLLALHRLTGQALALRPLLAEMVRVVAGMLPAEVVSVYLREQGPAGEAERLVMVANVGFPDSAIGNVVLGPGEGITGFAAECLRPVTTADASRETRYKPVSGLGEERFPAFLAVPFLVEGRAAGVLVAQRGVDDPFGAGTTTLGVAAAGAVAHAVDRARLRPGQGGEPAPPRPVRLDGVPISPGVTLGSAAMLPGWGELRAQEADDEDDPGQRGPVGAGTETDLAATLGRLKDELRRGLGKLPAGPWAARLAAATAALEDSRLDERIADSVASHGVVPGLREVARQYALAPIRASDPDERAWLLERAREMEDFCLLAAALARGTTLPGQGEVLFVPDRLGLWVTVLALGRGVGGVVLAGPVPDDDEAAEPSSSAPASGPSFSGDPGIALVRGADRPAVAEVAGVYGWVRPGDRVQVDGTAGWIRVHPALADVAAHRQRRRS